MNIRVLLIQAVERSPLSLSIRGRGVGRQDCFVCKRPLVISYKTGFGAGRETFVAKFQLRRYFAEEESLFSTLFLFEIPELFSDVPFGKLKEDS